MSSITPPGSSGSSPTSPVPGANPNTNAADKQALNLPGSTPLSPNDPWVGFMLKLFPQAAGPDLLRYAAVFKNNMFQWLNDEIKRDQDRAHRAAQDFKKALEDDDS